MISSRYAFDFIFARVSLMISRPYADADDFAISSLFSPRHTSADVFRAASEEDAAFDY